MFNLFSKTKEKEIEPEIGSKEIDKFCQRPFGHCRPVDYVPNEALFNKLPKMLDEWIEALLKGELDEGNEDVLDSLIMDHVRLAIEDVSLQYVKHIDTIYGLSNRLETDPKCFEDELEETRTILTRKEEEYETFLNHTKNNIWRK